MIKTNNKSSPHKGIKIPRADLHSCRTANRLFSKTEIDGVHSLVKADAFFIVLKQIDLVTAGTKIAQPYAYQTDGPVLVPGFFEQVFNTGNEDMLGCR